MQYVLIVMRQGSTTPTVQYYGDLDTATKNARTYSEDGCEVVLASILHAWMPMMSLRLKVQ